MSDTHKNTPPGEILLYAAGDGNTGAECRFIDDSLWLSQSPIAELFGVSIPMVNEHFENIYDGVELYPEATIREFRIVRREGLREVVCNINHYNLEASEKQVKGSKHEA